jgi:hypothetical protein
MAEAKQFDISSMEQSAISIDIDSAMHAIDIGMAPYVMPKVGHLFPFLSIDKGKFMGRWFYNAIFWAANLVVHGKEIGFRTATRGVEDSIRYSASHISNMLIDGHRSSMDIARETQRFVALIDILKAKSWAPVDPGAQEYGEQYWNAFTGSIVDDNQN